MSEIKQEERLKFRLYFFVPYNISPIQQAIQAGHAALEYAYHYGNSENYLSFIKNDKTWIILNGGTTNSERGEDLVSIGTLNQIADQLSLGDGISSPIPHAYFREPDLENALTAVCFLADERVWDYETYPDYVDWLINSLGYISPQRSVEIKMQKYEDLIKNPKYPEWIKFLGGNEIVFLRQLLKGKKLA